MAKKINAKPAIISAIIKAQKKGAAGDALYWVAKDAGYVGTEGNWKKHVAQLFESK